MTVEHLNEREKDFVKRWAHQLHTIPTFVDWTLLKDSLKGNKNYKGFIEDISLNQLSFKLRNDYFTLQESLVI